MFRFLFNKLLFYPYSPDLCWIVLSLVITLISGCLLFIWETKKFWFLPSDTCWRTGNISDRANYWGFELIYVGLFPPTNRMFGFMIRGWCWLKLRIGWKCPSSIALKKLLLMSGSTLMLPIKILFLILFCLCISSFSSSILSNCLLTGPVGPLKICLTFCF